MSRILPEQERNELRSLIEEALGRALPEWAEKIREGVASDMDKRFELLGLAADDHDERAEIRKDMEFMRGTRTAFRWAATKVGSAILTIAAFALAGLAGYGAYLKGLFGFGK